MRGKEARAFLTIFLFLLEIPLHAENLDIRAAEIDRFVTACYGEGLLNGTVLVAERGRVIYQKALGTANVEWEIPCALDTRFSIFSISKQFTAMLGLMMVADGRLDLDASVTDYLPYFRKETGSKIRVRHLFSHSHGIPYVSYDRLPYRNRLDKEAFFKTYYSQDLAFEPGRGFLYGDGFDILAAIIEEVSQKPFETLMRERIFEPLQLRETGFWHASANIKRMAANYRTSLELKSEPLYETPLNGSCALYSTVGDLFKWQRALAENRLLTKEYQDRMFQVQVDFGRPYGLGFDVSELEFAGQKKRVVWHEGGASAIFFWALDDDKLVILLNNFNGENYKVSREIMNILYGGSSQTIASEK